MSLMQISFLLLVIFLLITLYSKNKRIKHLESRIKQLTAQASSQSSEDERLVYLKTDLAHLDKVKAIKALRERYPELSLVEAYQLWEQQ